MAMPSWLRRVPIFAERRPDRCRVDLGWVDEFIDNVRPWIFVRESDRLLIKRPNEAQKLNRSGAQVLKALLDGARIDEVLDGVGRDPRKTGEIALFLQEIRRNLEGKPDGDHRSCAVEVRPFRIPFSRWPVLSEVAVTYRCNLRCTFCYAGCNCTTNPVGDGREMSADEIVRVLRRIREEAQVPSVSFTGGEPTLRPELPSLIRHAKQLDLRVNLITNGTRVDGATAGELSRAGLDSAQVSLEGTTAAMHEAITGSPGSFAKSVDAVRHLNDVGIRVHSNTTLCRPNLAESAGFPRFVRDRLELSRFSMNLVVPTGSAVAHGDLVVRYSELAPHLEAIAAASARAGVEFMWYSPTPICIFNPIARGLGNKGCAACDGLLSVAPNGQVLPCASFDEPLGSLLEQDVKRVWLSRRARRHRHKFLAHPQCRECEEFQVCNGACPLYWRQMGFEELVRVKGFASPPEEHFRQ